MLGKQPMLSPRSTARREPLPPLVLGEGCRVSAGAVLSAGTVLGDGCVVGDLATVRERCTIGDGVVIGRGVCVENDTTIGARTKIQSNAYITAYCTLEEDVFIAPCVITTNDNFMGRTERRHELVKGAVIRRGARVGGGATLLPAVEIGEEAFVGAGRGGAARRARRGCWWSARRRACCARCRPTSCWGRSDAPRPRRAGRRARPDGAARRARTWRRSTSLPVPDGRRRGRRRAAGRPAARAGRAAPWRRCEELIEHGEPGLARTGPRFFHFVQGGATPAALGADWLASAWDQNSWSDTAAPFTTRLETVALRWLLDLFGLPRTWGGVLTTGATGANLVALACARRWWGQRHDADVDVDGLTGLPPVPVIAGGYVHPSDLKALAVLGIGRGSDQDLRRRRRPDRPRPRGARAPGR